MSYLETRPGSELFEPVDVPDESQQQALRRREQENAASRVSPPTTTDQTLPLTTDYSLPQRAMLSVNRWDH